MENRGHIIAVRQRLEWVDVARGIGILAVVIGHVWTRGPLRDAMYSFHMPLFFLLSGLVSRSHPVGAFARRQVVTQMRPYAAFLTLLILADQIIEPLKGGRPIFHQWPQDMVPILLGGSWLRGPYTIFWFVPCLMLARILFNVALTRWPDPMNRRWALLIPPVLLIGYGVGYGTAVSPLGLLSVPMAFMLLWVGAVWSHVPWTHMPWMRGWLLPLGLLSIAGLAVLVPPLNMKAGAYGWPLLSIGSAIATSLLIVRLSVLIAPVAFPLAGIGRASLVIMYLHVAVIHYGSPYLGKPWLLAAALVAPFGLFHLIRRCPPAKRLFL